MKLPIPGFKHQKLYHLIKNHLLHICAMRLKLMILRLLLEANPVVFLLSVHALMKFLRHCAFVLCVCLFESIVCVFIGVPCSFGFSKMNAPGLALARASCVYSAV